MRINRLKFIGFQNSSTTAEVEFSKSDITVIFGDNGCGKTTFLRSISAFLSRDDEVLASLGVSSVECWLEENGALHFINVERIGAAFNWTPFDQSPLSSSSSLSLGVERGISTQPLKIEVELILEFLNSSRWRNDFFSDNIGPHNRWKMAEFAEDISSFLRKRNAAKRRLKRPDIDFDVHHLHLQSIKIENVEQILLSRFRVARYAASRKIQNALFDTLALAIDARSVNENWAGKAESDLPKRLFAHRDRLVEALDDGDENNFKSSIIKILNSVKSEGDVSEHLQSSAILCQLFINMLNELEEENLLLNKINLLVEKFNSYLIDGKRLVVNMGEVQVDLNGTSHSLSDLSSGERHILTFLSMVLFVGHNRDFLIIDEPEISLNVKWQRALLSVFSELVPNTQIIVASHAPAIAKRNVDSLVPLLIRR